MKLASFKIGNSSTWGVIDGDEALRRIRANSQAVGLPVVALTASVMTEDRARILGAGFDGFLEKPINVREFPAQVRSYL